MDDSIMPARSNGSAAPRCDGFYHARSKSGDYTYLARFYPDGEVITVTVADGWTPASIMAWFKRSRPDVSKGPYVVLGTSICFVAESSHGRVDYAGFLMQGVLRISSFSQINGNHEVDRCYVFAPASLVNEGPAW
jgi:hypothetical protein